MTPSGETRKEPQSERANGAAVKARPNGTFSVSSSYFAAKGYYFIGGKLIIRTAKITNVGS